MNTAEHHCPECTGRPPLDARRWRLRQTLNLRTGELTYHLPQLARRPADDEMEPGE